MSFSLELKNISFRYTGLGGSERLILDDVSLHVGENESVALVGPSGSGKTTLIQHFTGLLRPVSGQIFYNEKNIWDRKFSLSKLREKIGIVFQFPESQLFEETVFKDVAFGPKNLGYSPDEIEKRVHEALLAVELKPQKFGERSPFRLSEGEKRRAAIAGVLAMEPDLIVFDEPTAGLDPQGVRRMADIAKRLLDAGKSVLVVTHNMDFVAQAIDRVVVINKGKILFDGATKALFTNESLLDETGLDLPVFDTVVREMRDTLPDVLKNIENINELLRYFK
ncbi:MAG: energy-coupling factor transporter ATPase [Calditrichaeota bacterium]|nr:energy-coupling factor transporter ATPase [Calditrichota bacterium]